MNSFLFNLCAPQVIIELAKYFLWVYPVEHFNFVPFFPSPCLSLAETGKLETEVRAQLERAGEAEKCLPWLNRTTKNLSSFCTSLRCVGAARPGRECFHLFRSAVSAVCLQKVRFKDQIMENVSLQNITAEGLEAQKLIFAGSRGHSSGFRVACSS